MRSHAEKRHLDWIKAIRKKRIVDQYGFEWYNNLHQYSKGKIHCSCGMCSRFNKTKNKGKHRNKIPGNYAPSVNWSAADKRRITEMEEQIIDNEEEF